MSNAARFVVLTGTELLPMTKLAKALDAKQVQTIHLDAASLRESIEKLSSPPDALVVGLYGVHSNVSDSVKGAFNLIDAIRQCRDVSGCLPRYAIGIFPQSQEASLAAVSAAAGSLMRYVTSHMLYEDISINLIAYRDTALGLQRAADTTQALLSGLLDTVRGQTFVLTDD